MNNICILKEMFKLKEQHYRLDSDENIIELRLQRLRLSNVEFLGTIKTLIWLYLDNNYITDITPLKSLKSLKTLYLNNNRIESIDALSELNNIHLLDLSNNKINSITSLIKMKQTLQWLNLSNNQIEDMSPIFELNIPNIVFYEDVYLGNEHLINVYNNPVTAKYESGLRLKKSDFISMLNNLEIRQQTKKLKMEKKKYEICLSYASEDKEYVSKVALYLKQNNVQFFFDDYNKVELWGKDLYQYLSDLYKNRCDYCVMFISRHYKEKLWTNHERKNAQARAFSESREYILPARFDNTEIEGIPETIGYIDVSTLPPDEFGELILNKLKSCRI